MMRVIKNLIVVIFAIALTSCGARIPTSIDAAKRKVEKNYRQIEAIIDYHDLRNPFVVTDTVVFRKPPSYGRFDAGDNISFLSGFDMSFDKYIKPSLKDTSEADTIKSIVYKYINKPIDYSYEDSIISIKFSGTSDSLIVDYKVKEQESKIPIEYQKNEINTDVKWYEDRFVKIALIIVLAGVFASIIISIIRKPQ